MSRVNKVTSRNPRRQAVREAVVSLKAFSAFTIENDKPLLRRDLPWFTPDEADRFLARIPVQSAEECWIWVGAHSDGYGTVWSSVRKRILVAHRVAYELLVGDIPDGLQLDHLCRVRDCVNPAHLESVTSQENTLRGDGIAARNARKTHCKRGHAFDEENTFASPTGRGCRACRSAQKRERYRRAAAA